MSTASSNPGDIDLEGLIQTLPACKRCRECRRGCDTQLPKCKQCTKSGAECIFFDHGRNEFLPRSYIAGLVDHVRRLVARNDSSGETAQEPTGNVPAASGEAPQEPTGNAPAASGETPQEPFGNAPAKTESVVSDVQHQYEHHFAYAGSSYRYLGQESCLVKSPRLLSGSVQVPVEDDDDWQLSWKQSDAKNYELVEVYLEAIQPLYPVVDLSARYLSPEPPADLTDTERFHLNMIYSIACHVIPSTTRTKHPEHQWDPSGRLSYHQGNSVKYRILAAARLKSAMDYLEEATSESTIDTLRAVLLLVIHCLFDPKTGNIGQQVALAARLALTLESQIEWQELGSRDAEVMRNMHSTIFSIENGIASTLDRPATFPEPDWELCFDSQKPADYLCSLYRLQHKFRKGDRAAKEAVKKHLPRLDEKGLLLPSLRIALHQTHLLLNPCWGSAWYVLEAVVSSGSMHIFLTPHWVYRAGAILVESMPEVYPDNLIQLYANALVVLSLSSWKWPSSATLSASLSELMSQTKAKYRPEWAGNLIHYDVQELLGGTRPRFHSFLAQSANRF